ncbi:DUF554 domain-containing protein [Rhodovulum strictum]|uniref:DUF554 family protein n=1 Tax=Rhodovulum strictum TaxID=58314 RepID=A0A844B2S2_9RHOB|nr:DUF554 domain-containing protein [Rhodovulum strictum]MRH20676.1 DUF554 family protein [Rhodovulum strictum]
MIGPIANALCTLTGGVLGSFAGHRLSEATRARLVLVLGLAAMGMGVAMIVRVHALPPVIMALLVGTVAGELLRIESRLTGAAGALRRLIDRLVPPMGGQGLPAAAHADRLVAVLVLFVASGTGIFGAMNEGITGDPSILLVKAMLDLVTAGIFAAELGLSVAAIAVPQLVAQMGFLLLGMWIMPMLTPAMVADFSSLGGIIMLATGLRICAIAPFPVANMLPGLLLVMPLSALMG